MIAYIVDDAVLVAGLAAGTESQRCELSRRVHGSLDGGPPLNIPAVCLTAAFAVRSAIAEHAAMLVTDSPAGVVEIRGLAGGQLAGIIAEYPGLGYPAAHAVSEATRDGAVILTVDVDRYAGVPVSAIAL